MRRITPMTTMAKKMKPIPSPRRLLQQLRRRRSRRSASITNTKTRGPTTAVLELNITGTKRKMIIRQCLLTVFTSGSHSVLARASKRPEAICSSTTKTERVSTLQNVECISMTVTTFLFLRHLYRWKKMCGR